MDVMKLALMGGITFVGIVYGLWVRWLLWCWFAVPLGAPEIGMLHVAGVSMFLWQPPVLGQINDDADDIWVGWLKALIYGVTVSTGILAMGFLFSLGVA